MSNKKSKLLVLIIFFLGGGMGWYGWNQQNDWQNNILGQVVEAKTVNVLKIIQDENQGVVILPPEAMRQSADGFYVLTVIDNQVQKKTVQAQVWREKYYRIISGLEHEDLVILDDRFLEQQTINYIVINPEAGQSGVIGL